jgi:hypothetical protein
MCIYVSFRDPKDGQKVMEYLAENRMMAASEIGPILHESQRTRHARGWLGKATMHSANATADAANHSDIARVMPSVDFECISHLGFLWTSNGNRFNSVPRCAMHLAYEQAPLSTLASESLVDMLRPDEALNMWQCHGN